jgi:beta-N-acetylhexosaminidase
MYALEYGIYAFEEAMQRLSIQGAALLIVTGFGLLSIEANYSSAELPERPTGVRVGWVETTLKTLTLEKKVGQLIQIRFYADYPTLETPEYKQLRSEIQQYGIGSLLFGMHTNESGLIRVSPVNVARAANQLQSDSELPLLLAADLERGAASRLKDVPSFPWPMAFGAIGDASEVERFASITAIQSRAVGVQWVLAPIADVNSNPMNPVINDRSFGESSDDVTRLVEAYIRGAHANGILVSAKHFPGHGDSSTDSHLGVSSIDVDEQHLEKVEFPPFMGAIAAGADSIMLAHARVPALDPDPSKIATISEKIITATLREKMGFQGVILSDALEMKGLTALYDPAKGSPTARAAVDAVKAGCDIIMVPTDVDGAFHAIVNAVRSGEIPESRIDESVRRILQIKVAVGLDRNRLVDLKNVEALTSRPEDFAFAQRVSDEAVTLVRDNTQMLPFRPLGFTTSAAGPSAPNYPEKLAVVLLGERLEQDNGRAFETEIRKKRPDAAIFRFDARFSAPMTGDLDKTVKAADRIILASYGINRAIRKVSVDGKEGSFYGPRGLAGQVFRDIVSKYPEKTIVVALGSPYVISSFPQIQAYVCTYAMASTSEVSAVKSLFGEIQNHARLPVTLPGIAPRGFSLPWPSRSVSPETSRSTIE